MQWTFRTAVRAFMIVAGGYFLASGLTGGGTFEALLGVAGVVLGAVGLLAEWRASTESSDAAEPPGE